MRSITNTSLTQVECQALEITILTAGAASASYLKVPEYSNYPSSSNSSIRQHWHIKRGLSSLPELMVGNPQACTGHVAEGRLTASPVTASQVMKR